tara:strand:- start:275 stop:1060 length:786 start_codon:yes stop_codon:yes gene_type:complete
MNNFKKIAEVELLHQFYSWNRVPGLTIEQTPETQMLCKRYGFLIRQKDSLISLFLKADQLSDLLDHLELVNGIQAFEFLVKVSNADFFCYTAFPSNGNSLQFSSEEVIENESVLNLKPQEDSQTLGKQEIKIQLKFDDLKNNNSSKPYQIRLNAKESYWTYHFVKKEVADLASTLSVIDDNKKVNFSDGSLQLLPNGVQSLCFTSTSQIVMEQQANPNFNLMDKKNSKIIVKDLPTPQPCNLSLNSKNGEQTLHSPIYVYL